MVDSLKHWSPERAREVEAVMRLHCLPRVGSRTLWRILERFGSGVAALRCVSSWSRGRAITLIPHWPASPPRQGA